MDGLLLIHLVFPIMINLGPVFTLAKVLPYPGIAFIPKYCFVLPIWQKWNLRKAVLSSLNLNF